MADALSIALSGLNAQSQSLAATASNIANVSTTGIIPGTNPSALNPSLGASTVYLPLQVTFLSQVSGGVGDGVQAQVTPDPNGYSVIYDPQSSYANAQGLLAAPNVDLAQQAVNLSETSISFQADISVIKTEQHMLGDLLDAIA